MPFLDAMSSSPSLASRQHAVCEVCCVLAARWQLATGNHSQFSVESLTGTYFTLRYDIRAVEVWKAFEPATHSRIVSRNKSLPFSLDTPCGNTECEVKSDFRRRPHPNYGVSTIMGCQVSRRLGLLIAPSSRHVLNLCSPGTRARRSKDVSKL